MEPTPPPEAQTPPSAAVHVALLGVQVAFGTLAVEGKIAMGTFGVSPEALGMVRILGGALVFGIAHAALRTPRVASAADMAKLAALGLFGIVLNQILFLKGLRQTSPMAATLLVATIPVFASAIAAIAGRDRFTGRKGAGIALAVLGIGVLTRFAVPHRGDLLVLLNSLSYAIYVVFAKGMLARYGTFTVVAWVFGAGAVLFAPLGGLELLRDAPRWSAGAIGMVAFIVLVPTLLAYSLNAWALRRAPPTLVAIYVYLQPLVVAVLAWLQLGQALDVRTALAGLLIFSGVTVVVTAPRVVPA